MLLLLFISLGYVCIALALISPFHFRIDRTCYLISRQALLHEMPVFSFSIQHSPSSPSSLPILPGRHIFVIDGTFSLPVTRRFPTFTNALSFSSLWASPLSYQCILLRILLDDMLISTSKARVVQFRYT